MSKLLTFLVFVAGVATAGVNAKLFQYPHVPNQLVIKFKDTDAAKQLMFDLDAKFVDRFDSSGAYLVEFRDALTMLKTATELADDESVEYYEPNYYYYLQARLPNDKDFAKLYGLHNPGALGTKDADIDAPEAWDITVGSKDITVAVIDTGIDYKHKDLAPNYWRNPGETGKDARGRDKSKNGVDDDNNGYVDDFRGWDFINNDNDPLDKHGHGTHCAGTIGALGNDKFGVVGVNWRVSLVGLQIFSRSGQTTLAAITKAIDYATKMKFSLTSNSWGGSAGSKAIEEAVKRAQKAGIIFVAAAGNAGVDMDKTNFYPAGYPFDNIISVSATDSRDRLARFSNYGKKNADVGAPGVAIWSTKPGGGFQSMSGTSMAAPHVAGLTALVMAQYRNLDYKEIRKRVITNVDKIPALKGKVVSDGRINAYKALQ